MPTPAQRRRLSNQQWHQRHGYDAPQNPAFSASVFEMQGPESQPPAVPMDGSPVETYRTPSSLRPDSFYKPGRMAIQRQPMGGADAGPSLSPGAMALLGSPGPTGLGRQMGGRHTLTMQQANQEMANVGEIRHPYTRPMSVTNNALGAGGGQEAVGPYNGQWGKPEEGLSLDALSMMGGTGGYNQGGLGGIFAKFANHLGERYGQRRRSELGLAGAMPTMPQGGAQALGLSAGEQQRAMGNRETPLQFARRQETESLPQYVNEDGQAMLNDPNTLDARVAHARALIGADSGRPPGGRGPYDSAGGSGPGFAALGIPSPYQEQLQMRQMNAQTQGMERGLDRKMRIAGRKSGSGYGAQVQQRNLNQMMANQLGLANRGLDLQQQGQQNEFTLGQGGLDARRYEADSRRAIAGDEFALGGRRLEAEKDMAAGRNKTMTDINNTNAQTTLDKTRIEHPIDGPLSNPLALLGIPGLREAAPDVYRAAANQITETITGKKSSPSDSSQQDLITATKAGTDKYGKLDSSGAYSAIGPLMDAIEGKDFSREEAAKMMAELGLSEDALRKAGEHQPLFGYDKPSTAGKAIGAVGGWGDPSGYNLASKYAWTAIGEGKSDYGMRKRRQDAIKKFIASLHRQPAAAVQQQNPMQQQWPY